MNPIINNSRGKLTAYGFACGYQEEDKNKIHWKQMYMEHTHFHVRYGKIGKRWEIWETFDSDELTKARKFYNSIKL